VIERRVPAPETWIVVGLRSLALTIAAAALLLDVSLVPGTVAAVVGTLGASVLATPLSRSRVRTSAVWAIAALCALNALLLGRWLVNGSPFGDLLGPHGAMVAADVVRFGLLATAVTFAVRTTSARRPAFAIVELALVSLALAGVVAAHRDGAINHPRALSDWAWTRGIDPVRILLYLGGATLAALLLATLHERRGRGPRVVLHVLALLLFAGASLFLVTSKGLPVPPRGEGLGLTGKNPKDGKPDKGGKGGKGGQGGAGGQASNQLDQLEFKDNYESSSAPAPVAVVLLHDDYSPPLGYYYFRQTAFSQYNGHRLVAATRDDVDQDILGDFPTEKMAVVDPQHLANAGAARTPIHTTVALLTDHLKPFGLETPVEFAPRESPDPTRFVRAYDVTSAALAMRYEDLLGKQPGVKSWTDEQRAYYTQLPDDPRYKQLADEIVDGSLKPQYRSDPFAEALAISNWLGKNSIYSLKSKHADAGDPTADFLFGDKIGYCVHFAHAAAFLLRARGLPARIAAGYVADEERKGTGSAILLRQKDAHAWAELYLDGFGWIIVDVAPQRVLDPPDTPPDPDLQRMLGELARGDKTAGKSVDGRAKPIPWRAIGLRALLAVLFVLAQLYLVKLWRRFVPLVAGAGSVHRVAYRAALDGLVEAGFRREPGETRERFAARLGALSPSLVPLTRAHVGRAFGGRALPPPVEMRRLGRAATREARSRARWWRVLLGALDPTSWLRSR